jgi:hypothetical protein
MELVGLICKKYLDGNAIVFNPQFISDCSDSGFFRGDSEYFLGYPAYRLTVKELALLTSRGLIDFDWTDIKISGSDGSLLCYLQIIDSTSCYAKVEGEGGAAFFENIGFLPQHGMVNLPQEMQDL